MQAQYPGHPGSTEIAAFALERVEAKIRVLGKNFEDKVSFSKHRWLINFGAPWVRASFPKGAGMTAN
jgi:hypothetical protein